MASPGYLPAPLCVLLAILLQVVPPVSGGEYCRASYSSYSSYYYGTNYYIYCPGSCCGSYYSQYCCDYMAGGAIAGTVIGCLVGLGMLITLIVCLCGACNKTGTKRGRVVYPNNQQQPSVAIVNTSTHTGASYPQHGATYPQGQAYPPPGQANPPQGQGYPPPPQYAYPAQGPAYPPPPGAAAPGQFVPPPKYSDN